MDRVPRPAPSRLIETRTEGAVVRLVDHDPGGCLALAVAGALLSGPGQSGWKRSPYEVDSEPSRRRPNWVGWRRPTTSSSRVRAGEEVGLESFQLFASRDLLTRAALDRMLGGLSTRRYRAGLEPVGK